MLQIRRGELAPRSAARADCSSNGVPVSRGVVRLGRMTQEDGAKATVVVAAVMIVFGAGIEVGTCAQKSRFPNTAAFESDRATVQRSAESFAQWAHPGDIRMVTCRATPERYTGERGGAITRYFHSCRAIRVSTSDPFMFRCELANDAADGCCPN